MVLLISFNDRLPFARGACQAAKNVPAIGVGFQEYAVYLLRFKVPNFFELEGLEVGVEVPREGGEGGGEAGADGGEALPPVLRHPLAVDQPLLQAGEGDVDGEAADLRRVAHDGRRVGGSTAGGGGGTPAGAFREEDGDESMDCESDFFFFFCESGLQPFRFWFSGS